MSEERPLPLQKIAPDTYRVIRPSKHALSTLREIKRRVVVGVAGAVGSVMFLMASLNRDRVNLNQPQNDNRLTDNHVSSLTQDSPNSQLVISNPGDFSPQINLGIGPNELDLAPSQRQLEVFQGILSDMEKSTAPQIREAADYFNQQEHGPAKIWQIAPSQYLERPVMVGNLMGKSESNDRILISEGDLNNLANGNLSERDFILYLYHGIRHYQKIHPFLEVQDYVSANQWKTSQGVDIVWSEVWLSYGSFYQYRGQDPYLLASWLSYQSSVKRP
ncbi:hypothetical protein HYU92_02745 [Candidatus Curtissbacteria bacterium]|nr:hypothetical protein [Candidatus Curtissbacteria bacterium]